MKFLIVIHLLLLVSCSPILLVSYGIENPKNYQSKKIERRMKKYQIDVSSTYKINNSYKNFLKIAINDTTFLGYLYQPLQLKIYNINDSLILHKANCQLGGFPNLNWDIDHYFKSKIKCDTFTSFKHPRLSEELQLIMDTNQNIREAADFTFVVVWSMFMKRQSKRLVQYAKELRNEIPDKKVNFIYFNIDELYK